MTYNRNFDNELKLAPGVDPFIKLEAMHGGPATPTFFPETKQYIYDSAGTRYFKMFSHNLRLMITIHPLTGQPLWERAFLCPYCVLTKSLNIYHHKFNCNLDHLDPFAGLMSESNPPSVIITLRGAPNSFQINQLRQRAFRVGLLEDEYENIVRLNWKDKRHRQLIYNDLNNLEITCHGHNRIKGDHLDREGSIGMALLISMNRAHSTVTTDD